MDNMFESILFMVFISNNTNVMILLFACLFLQNIFS